MCKERSKQKGDENMEYNKVELLSQHNCSRLFIDGTEIKGVTRLDIHRDANDCKTEISIDFECDLNTVQLKKDRVIVNECDYEELQKLATPLQEWLLKHCSAMYAIRIDNERVVIVADEVSAPFGDE